MIRCIARTLATAFLAAVLLASPAAAQVQPYGTNDYGGFHNVLPPGTNGFDNAAELGVIEATKQEPAHSSDQLQMYSNLTTAAGQITAQTLGQYYKDATFGVPPGDVGTTESPEPGVTIIRDKAYGVPHIYGDTRAELMFGIGYATAEDRLFFIDVLRHAGEGDLASFAGGANVGMDEQVWASEPYTHQDLVNQVNNIRSGPDGAQVYSDATNYVAGINAYIEKAKQPLNTLSMMPAEYAAIGQPSGPANFSLTDLVSIATLVGGIFGNGGGDQLSNAMLYESLARKFGRERYVVPGSPTVIPTAKKKHRRKSAHGHKQAIPARAGTHRTAKHKAPKKKKKKKSTTPGSGRSSASMRPTTPRRRRRCARGSSTTSRCRGPPRRWRGRSRCRTRARSRTCRSSWAGPRRGRRPGPLGHPGRGARASASGRWPTPVPGCCRSRAACPTRCWSAPRTAPADIRWR